MKPPEPIKEQALFIQSLSFWKYGRINDARPDSVIVVQFRIIALESILMFEPQLAKLWWYFKLARIWLNDDNDSTNNVFIVNDLRSFWCTLYKCYLGTNLIYGKMC